LVVGWVQRSKTKSGEKVFPSRLLRTAVGNVKEELFEEPKADVTSNVRRESNIKRKFVEETSKKKVVWGRKESGARSLFIVESGKKKSE
jgi:hypothetical protein